MISETISSRYSVIPVRLSIRAALFISVFLGISFSPGLPVRMESSITALSSVSATLLGFIIASATLLISIIDKPFVRNLNRTGHMSVVWKQLLTSGGGMLLALTSSLAALALADTLALYAVALSFAFASVAGADLVDCASKLMKIMARI